MGKPQNKKNPKNTLGIRVNEEEFNNYKNLSIVDNDYSDRVTRSLFNIFEALYKDVDVISEAFKKLSDGLLIEFPCEKNIPVAVIEKRSVKHVYVRLYAIRSYSIVHLTHSQISELDLMSMPFYKIRFYLKPDSYKNDKLPEIKNKRFCWGEIPSDETAEVRYFYEDEAEDEY